MAKMKDLFGALSAICDHARGILEEAESIKEMFSAQEDQKMIEAEFTEPEKTYTIEDVRAVLIAKTKAGYRKEVKALLEAHGAEKLNDLAPGEYAATIAEAEGIGT